MATPTHVFVTAAADREVPMPQNEVSSPGGVQMRCLPGKRYRVPWTTYTRRRINSGDLILVDEAGRPVSDFDRAHAPTAAALAPDGSIASPEPEPITAAATEHTTEATTEHTTAGHAFDTADLDLPANPPSKG